MDGFAWWVGQIEGTASLEKNNKGGYRYKVAIVGEHPKSREIVSTDELPWANVMMPVNQPFSPGNITGAASQLTPGCWVVGFIWIMIDKNLLLWVLSDKHQVLQV